MQRSLVFAFLLGLSCFPGIHLKSADLADKDAAMEGWEPDAPGTPRKIELNNQKISEVLVKLAEVAGINLVVSQQITGSVTLRLEKKTAREALEIICQANGLFIDEMEGTFYIKTQVERAQEPTEFAQFTFKRAKVADVIKVIKSEMHSGVEPQFDVRTNTVFYHELRSNMKRLKQLLNFLDSPVDR